MDVRLAYHPEGDRTLSAETADPGPSLLVSYYYLANFARHRHRYRFRDWVLDSGAYSAHNCGATIRLDEYIDSCKMLISTDPSLTEVFALDVIGDWRAGARNTGAMWARGVPAVPTFHPGEPWDLLKGYARDYPKVALGGVVGWPAAKKRAFVGQCFARVWPKAVHGLGMSGEDMLLRFPFHSVDATNWEVGPCRFGRWASYGGKLSVRGGGLDLRAEVEWYRRLERRARARWEREMRQIPGYGTAALTCRPGGPGPAGGGAGPALRLAAQQGSDAQVRRSGLAAAEGGGA